MTRSATNSSAVSRPMPELAPGTALLKVHAAGINFADTFFIRGEYMIKPRLPDTPGMEAAGVIEEHMRSDHPELVGKVTRDDLKAMAEEA